MVTLKLERHLYHKRRDMEHIELVNQVIKMMLVGDDEVLMLLKKQFESAKIISEEVEEAGFYINYYVDKFEIMSEQFNNTFQIGDVDGEVNGVEGAIGFILYVKNGFLIMLEGYTNVIDKWPNANDQIILKYDTGETRDYKALRRKWIKK